MKNILYILCLLVACHVAYATPAIIPQPRELKTTNRSFELKSDAIITYSDARAQDAAERLAAQLRPATGFTLRVKKGKNGAIHFKTERDDTLGNEGYTLSVDDQVVIGAQTSAGHFYGAQTLRQLLPPEIFGLKKVAENWYISGVSIRDYPLFKWRGLHLDVARHFISKKDVLQLIDTMASLKLNMFHMHLTDDQGWRVEIKKYPKLTEIGAWRRGTLKGHKRDFQKNDLWKSNLDEVRHGGFYTQDDIREMVAFAAERHITIVPEIDMPGHMQAAVASYPELGCTDEIVEVWPMWGISKYILSPEESTVQFCKDVLAEVMELFPSEYIHIGGDEVPKHQWEASERIQQLREERGLKDMHEMQTWFTAQLNDFLIANQRRLVGWDEITDEDLPQSTVIMCWHGPKKGMPQKALDTGNDIVIANSGALYFNKYQAVDRTNEPLASGGKLTLDRVYRFNPAQTGTDQILGVQGHLWSEYIKNGEMIEYMAFPRTLALAEIVWIPEDRKEYESFLKRAIIHQKRFDAAGVNYRKIENPQ